jgi:hypothetical protein
LAAASQDHVDFGLDSDQAADTTPPQLTVPNDLHAEATSPSGAVVSFSTGAADIVDGALSVTCTPLSGSTFPLGSTTVHCSATDHSGNAANASFVVIVADTTTPLITSVTATPSVLWPPNSKMVAVTVRVTASDAADPAFTAKIVGVSSDQPVGSEPDWAITGPLTLQLRAKRNGSGTRTYTIIVECRDHAGNVSTGRVTVVVPHDQGQ